jgi:hypothetical protein
MTSEALTTVKTHYCLLLCKTLFIVSLPLLQKNIVPPLLGTYVNVAPTLRKREDVLQLHHKPSYHIYVQFYVWPRSLGMRWKQQIPPKTLTTILTLGYHTQNITICLVYIFIWSKCQDVITPCMTVTNLPGTQPNNGHLPSIVKSNTAQLFRHCHSHLNPLESRADCTITARLYKAQSLALRSTLLSLFDSNQSSNSPDAPHLL